MPPGLISGILADLVELWDIGTGANEISAPRDGMVQGSAELFKLRCPEFHSPGPRNWRLTDRSVYLVSYCLKLVEIAIASRQPG
jgi:hypothetical protein